MEEEKIDDNISSLGAYGEGLTMIQPNHVKGGQGYSTILSAKGIKEGSFYFETEVLSYGNNGNIRIGITNENLQNALSWPVGKHPNSYGVRLSDGYLFNDGIGKPGIARLEEGDTLGFVVLLLPIEPPIPFPKLQINQGRSAIILFINGQFITVAYEDLAVQTYFAAASLYNSAEVKLHLAASDCVHDYKILTKDLYDQYPDLVNLKDFQAVAFDQVEFDLSFYST